MNQRAAKRLVCHEASLVLENAMEAGWEYWDGKTEVDTDRWETAMRELIEELHMRGLYR